MIDEKPLVDFLEWWQSMLHKFNEKNERQRNFMTTSSSIHMFSNGSKPKQLILLTRHVTYLVDKKKLLLFSLEADAVLLNGNFAPFFRSMLEVFSEKECGQTTHRDTRCFPVNQFHQKISIAKTRGRETFRAILNVSTLLDLQYWHHQITENKITTKLWIFHPMEETLVVL